MQSIIERRSYPRHYDHTTIVELRLNETSSASTILAADVNTSYLGMCVLTLDSLEKGNVVNIQKSFSMESRSAKIVWVREYHPDLYKVGLNYLQ